MFIIILSGFTYANEFSLLHISSDSTDNTWEPSPKIALYASLIYPGLGQFYLKKWFKGFTLVSFQAYNIYQFLHYNKLYGYVTSTRDAVIDTSSIQYWETLGEQQKLELIQTHTGHKLTINSWRPRAIRDKYGWWILATTLYAMLDAYVDAHLYNFEKKTRLDVSYNNTVGGVNFQFSIKLNIQ